MQLIYSDENSSPASIVVVFAENSPTQAHYSGSPVISHTGEVDYHSGAMATKLCFSHGRYSIASLATKNSVALKTSIFASEQNGLENTASSTPRYKQAPADLRTPL
jgi:hypothetical protein